MREELSHRGSSASSSEEQPLQGQRVGGGGGVHTNGKHIKPRSNSSTPTSGPVETKPPLKQLAKERQLSLDLESTSNTVNGGSNGKSSSTVGRCNGGSGGGGKLGSSGEHTTSDDE